MISGHVRSMLLCMIIIVISLLIFTIYTNWRIKRVRKTSMLSRLYSWDSICSGDLYLSQFVGTGCAVHESVFTHLTGTAWTHVGIFHRDTTTNELFVLEFGDDGVRYSTLTNRMKYYAGYIGVRHLRQALTLEQLTAYQALVDDTMRGHNRSGESIETASFTNNTCRVVNLSSNKRFVEYHARGNMVTAFANTCFFGTEHSKSMLCTDLVLALLLRLGVVVHNNMHSGRCVHPDFFWKDHRLNAVYGPTLLIKNFETEHDHRINHCRYNGTRPVQVDDS